MDKITVNAVSPTTISISWRLQMDLLNSTGKFVVTFDPQESTGVDLQRYIPVNTTEFTCENLLPDTQYNISVQIPTEPPITGTILQKTGKNPCSVNPCENGGTCRAVIGQLSAYTCQCLPCFEGPHCETLIDMCSSNPCQNSGVCKSDAATCQTYTCECKDCYEGFDCEIHIDPCKFNPCKNDTARCVLFGDSCYDYECFCEDPVLGCFTGDRCHIRNDPCLPNPCTKGLCIRDESFCNATCQCPDCYIGEHCEVLIDPCNPNPCNEGTCVQQGRSCYQFACVCPECYVGQFCDRRVDDVCDLFSPCRHNGTCQAINGSCSDYTCICPECYDGQICQDEFNPCKDMPCMNDGQCIAMNNSCTQYSCNCSDCYSGEHCENFTSACEVNRCLNGGTCIPDDEDCTKYKCECQGMWFWTDCSWNMASALMASQVFLLMTIAMTIVICKRKDLVVGVFCTLKPARTRRTSLSEFSVDNDKLIKNSHDLECFLVVDWSFDKIVTDIAETEHSII
ncbi:uncharacterized protein LOC144436956 [Glandiceps talaboti]